MAAPPLELRSGPSRALCLAAVALLAGACAREPAATAGAAPHVVVIVVDDLGWGEVGYQGGRVATPNIDALARSGVSLGCFYAQPICTATRAALLTGRDPIRFGLGAAVVTPWRDFGLPSAERTLPEILGESGYARRGAFGKWHLGHLARQWHPLRQGFTRFRGHYNGAIDYFTHEREGERDWHEGFRPLYEEGYATDLIAEAACAFIAEEAGEGPLFCYVAFNAPHAPLQAPRAWLERFSHLAAPDGSLSREQVHAAMVGSLDEGIGRVLAAIEEAGIAEDTLVWFLSDNGAGPELEGSNGPWRGGKLTLYEGGLRVPSAVRWPRGLPAGTLCDEPLAVVDVLPTVLQAAGLSGASAAELDGSGMLPVLRGQARVPARDLFFFYAQDGGDAEQLGLRSESSKLIVRGPDLSGAPFGPAHSAELYDLASDPGEARDLAALRPARVAELLERLIELRRRRPVRAVAPFWEGSEGFVAPRDWRIPDAD